jgi:hypothetical protein
MKCKEFPDKSATLFGRVPDLDFLSARIEKRGITAVLGRPQMGKSSLLVEFARQASLSAEIAHSDKTLLGRSFPSSFLVGFAESGAENPDLMLRVVADLYCRWFASSNYWEQAEVLYGLHKKDLVGTTGEAVGSLFSAVSRLAGKPLEAIGALVKEAFDKLAVTNRELKSGGQLLPRLQTEQSLELLTLLYKISHRPLVLILDQWEKSPNLEMESKILDSFLRHLDEWPPCHMFLGVRSDGRSREILRQLRKGFEGAMECYELQAMHLDESSIERMLGYLRDRVPVSSEASDSDLLEMIAGYPGVVSKWTAEYNQERLDSVGSLRATAVEAHDNRFDEFETILANLASGASTLSMRLSLMSAAASEDGWNLLRSVALDGCNVRDLDILKRIGVLEGVSPPTFGHSTRLEAALRWFSRNCEAELGEITDHLILSLGSAIENFGTESISYASVLAELYPVSVQLNASSVCQAACIAASSLFKPPDIDSVAKLLEVSVSSDESRLSLIALLAMGLDAAISHAKWEDAYERVDALLDGLRNLNIQFPLNPIVRQSFSSGLSEKRLCVDFMRLARSFGGRFCEEEEAVRSEREVLDDLRSLMRCSPEDIFVRRLLMKEMMFVTIGASDRERSQEGEALLEEMRAVVHRYPTDLSACEYLIKTLYELAVFRRIDEKSCTEEIRFFLRRFPQDHSMRAIEKYLPPEQ